MRVDKRPAQLTITQSQPNHDAIRRLLESLQETRSVQIAVETRFVTGEPAFRRLRDVSKGNQWRAAGDVASWPAYLTDAQAKLILEASREGTASTLTTAPRLTLFNGQRAYALVSRQTAFVSNFVNSPASTQPAGFKAEIAMVHSGVLVDCQATMSKDRKLVTITLRPQLANLLEFTPQPWPKSPPGRDDLIIQVPHISAIKPTMTAPIPAGRTAIFRVHPQRDPPSATQPASHPVLLMVRPTIITPAPAQAQRRLSSGPSA